MKQNLQLSTQKRLLLLVVVLFSAALISFFYFQVVKAAIKIDQEPISARAIQDIEGEDQTLSDIQVNVEINSPTIRPGGTLIYTIRYTNSLASPVANVSIISSLSDKQTFDGTYQSNPLIPPENFSYEPGSVGGYLLTWQLGTLNAGATGSIVISTIVFQETEPSIDLPPILLGNSTIIETTQAGVSGNQSDAVSMLVGPLFEISKVVSPNPVFPGRFLYYVLTLENNIRIDSVPANHMVISDVLPENTAFVDASGDGRYDANSNTVVWNLLGPLNPGYTEVVTFTVQVRPDINSGIAIRNTRAEYTVTSDEVIYSAIRGENDANTTTAKLLQKTVSADRMSGSTALVYPTDPVTYTLTVHNPFTVTLNSVRVTDTLPGNPIPFTYLHPAAGSPAPIEVITQTGEIVWLVDLSPWGSASRSFVAQVPKQTYIPDNRTSQNYTNNLAAVHPDYPFQPQSGLATVRVEAPLTMNKIVFPTHGQPGETVVYTITLTNRGPFPVNSIRLTDTLQGGFRFVEMESGPAPLPEYSSNPIVWTGIDVPSGQTYTLSFVARINGIWLQTYRNSIHAFSEDTFIPARTNVAGVKVDPPLGLDKSVAPDEVFLNTPVNYVITVTNVSTSTFMVNEVNDYLPAGFYQIGGSGTSLATIILDPPVAIDPGEYWEGGFDALVSMDVACADLPKTYKNEDGHLLIHVTSPVDVWAANAVDLAPISVNPHILTDLIPYRQVVQAGDYVTYTLHLVNQSPVYASSATMILTLPPDVSYISTLEGVPPTSVNQNQLTWTGYNVPNNAERSIVLYTRVSPTAALGSKTSTFTAAASNICFGKLGTGEHPLGVGTIVVDDYIYELTKRPLTERVPPLTLVEYEVKLKNNDYYQGHISVITDTMPAGFTFYDMKSGPEPDLIQGNKIYWYNPLIPGKTTVTWRYWLQAAPLYGSYVNSVGGYSESGSVKSAESAVVEVLPLFDLKKLALNSQATPGSLVTYQIDLVNLSDAVYVSIRLTDTLPTGFTYVQMLPGYPAPALVLNNGNQPIWDGLSVGANCGLNPCITQLKFYAQVAPALAEGVYYNNIIGSSPSGGIPGPINTAPVTIRESIFTNWLFLPTIKRNN